MNKHNKLYKDVVVTNSSLGSKITIGDDSIINNSIINDYVEIDRRNYIHNSIIGTASYTGWNTYIGMADIGNYCSISRCVDIGGADHNYDTISTFPDEKMLGKIMKKNYSMNTDIRVKIGSDCWIGQGVTILKKKGIIIGNGAVIGAGAIITKDIPDYAIAVGVPAKIVGYRFSNEIINELLKIMWWNWSVEVVFQNWDLLHDKMTQNNLKKLRKIKENIDAN